MNDYKELIEDLRHYFYDTELVLDAADAIEQLVRERDTAIAATRKSCDTCKKEDFCMTDAGFPTLSACVSASKCNWKWRGVQNETD